MNTATGRTLLGFLVIGLFVLPPLLLMLWALGLRMYATNSDEPSRDRAASGSRLVLSVLIVGAAAASLAYRTLNNNHLDQTAALFMGLPTLLALTAVFSPSPRSAIGVACKAVTIGMLISVIFLWEGFLCIAMSAPLFYLVAIVAGFVIDRVRKGHGDQPARVFSLIALLSFGPMSLEGVTPALSLNRGESITETRIVHAGGREVEHAILSQPRFDRLLPRYLRAGFPRPVQTQIGDATPGSRWVIRFRGGETRLNGQEPADGDLVLELAGAQPGRLSWRAVSDTSHMTHFLSWKEAIVEWEAIDAETTRVTWTLKYRRGLDPAWYFAPMERYAVHLAASYLIDTVATP